MNKTSKRCRKAWNERCDRATKSDPGLAAKWNYLTTPSREYDFRNYIGNIRR